MPDDRLISVRDLLPSYFEPQAATDVNAGILRQAFRAHILFFMEAGVGMQPRMIAQSNVSDRDVLVRLLCETYSRAICECAFAMYFDGANPQSYVALRGEISELFGASVMLAVHDAVKARGIVLDELATPPPSPSAPAAPAER